MSEYLVKFELEYWSKLQRAFKADWPRSVSGYYILETQKEWITRELHYGFTVYCPFGDVQNGMVAINEKNKFYEVVIICPQEDTSNLEKALLTTEVIDWSQEVVIPYAPQNVLHCLSRALPCIGIGFDTHSSDSFILEKDAPLFTLKVPPDFYISYLRQEHVDLVNSTWPHRYPTSSWYFTSIIRACSGYGLFLKQDHTLVSWLFVNEAGTLGNLYTVEEYRRRGLAELILKHVCNILLDGKKDVFAFSVKGNFKASSLYRKIGFKCFGDVAWCYIKPRI